MRKLHSFRRRISSLWARLPAQRRFKKIVVPVVFRPDQDGPLKLEKMYVMDLKEECPPSGEDLDFCADDVHPDDTIFGKPLPLTAEQRAAWRSHEEVSRFPQTPEEVTVWRSAQKLIENWPMANEERKRPATEADALPPVLRRETDAHTTADYSFSTHSTPKKEKAPR